MAEPDIAKEWGKTPWEYDMLDANEKAEMMAYVWVSRQIESYHFEQSTKSSSGENGRKK